MTLASRIGALPPSARSRACCARAASSSTGRTRRASLPIEDYPLFKRRMVELSDQHWWGRKHTPTRQVEEARARSASRSTGRCRCGRSRAAAAGRCGTGSRRSALLEHLFAAGEVVIAGRDGLPARLRPARARDPALGAGRADAVGGGVPPRLHAARRPGPRRADRVGHRRALPLPGRRQGRCGRSSTRSSKTGLVRRVAVDDGGAPVVVPADAVLDGAPSGGVLLCPFDNLVWDRAFLERRLRLRPRDRGLQAGAAAGVRLLRAAVPRTATGSSGGST